MSRARLLALLLALASARGIGAQTPTSAAGPDRAGLPAPASDEGPAKARESPRGAVLEEVSGVVAEVDRKAHRVVLEAPTGRIALTLDRNTMVYTDAGLGTVLDVMPGVRLRVGRNSSFLAYWVQVRPPEARATSAPEVERSGPPGAGTSPAVPR